MRGEMIHDSSGAKEKEEVTPHPPFLFKGSKNDSSGTFKRGVQAPRWKCYTCSARSGATRGGMNGIKGGLRGEEARQSP